MGSGPITSPDCKQPKGLRYAQALFFGQISRWPFCRLPALKSAESRASTGWGRSDRFSVSRGVNSTPTLPRVQPANPANLGLHPDAINALRSRPLHWILGRKDPSRKMTRAKPANPAKAGSATGFPACASPAIDANPWAMRTIRNAAHRRKATRHKAFRGIRTIRRHNNENTWRHHRHQTRRQTSPTREGMLPCLPPARSMR